MIYIYIYSLGRRLRWIINNYNNKKEKYNAKNQPDQFPQSQWRKHHEVTDKPRADEKHE